LNHLSSASQNALLYVVTVLIWGSSWLAIKYQLGSVDPMVSVAYRFLLASGISWLYCRLSGRLMRYSLRDHGFMFLQGASLFALNYWLFYLSELTLTSGLAAVIFSTIVVMNMLNGVLFLKNRLELRVVAGAGLGLLGIMLVFWPEVTDFESGSENLFAAALAVLATMLASVGNIASARNQRAGIPVVQANTFGMTYGALLMLGLAWATGREFTFEMTMPYVSSLVFPRCFCLHHCVLDIPHPARSCWCGTCCVLNFAISFSSAGLFDSFRGLPVDGLCGMGMLLILAGNLLILKRST